MCIRDRLIVTIPVAKSQFAVLEAWRRKGNDVAQWAKEEKIKTLEITSFLENGENMLAFAEGAILGSYQFLKYNSKAEKTKTSLQEIYFDSELISEKDLEELS